MNIIVSSLVLLLLMIFPDDTAHHAFDALLIWGRNIVPILFPYMVFSRLLCQQLRRFSLPMIPVLTLLGLVGGSPSGASVLADSANRLSKRSLYTLSALCGTISPMFILGTLGAWTGNLELCRLFLFSHWLSAAISAGIIWLFSKERHKPSYSEAIHTDVSASAPLSQSIDAILQVGGCIITYSVLAGLLEKIFPPSGILMPTLHAFLEISGGSHAIWQSTLSFHTRSILLSAALGFSGMSVLAQNHAFLKSLNISMPQLLFFAFLRAICSGTCTTIFLMM